MGSDVACVYIGLGSNMNGPVDQVVTALVDLDNADHCRVIGHSSLYRSKPVGPQGQADYINAVAVIETQLGPAALLKYLHQIEKKHGRRRDLEHQRWGPRCLDLDMLVYDDVQSDDPELTLPHPEISRRNFVLYPLYEIAPQLNIPGLGRLYDLKKNCPDHGLECLESVSGSYAS